MAYYLDNDNYWRDDLDDREVMVSIHCLAYNHEKFIRDALEGFVKQQTDFRFEAIVHDDCSTDGTADIIREYAEKYPSIIKPIFETENQYCKGTLVKVMNSHLRGKYIAYCEGDDYWIDPLKLQKQVDFLQAHPDYSLVAANHHTDIVAKNSIRICKKPVELDILSMDQLIVRNRIATNTVCMKREVISEYEKVFAPLGKPWPFGDYPTWLMASSIGKLKIMPYVTSVYRWVPDSATKLTTERKQKEWIYAEMDTIDTFDKLYGLRPEAIDKGLLFRYRKYLRYISLFGDTTFYDKARAFFKAKGYRFAPLFMTMIRRMPKLMPLWRFIDKNNIGLPHRNRINL